MEVSMHEFVKHTTRWLKECPLEITVRGVVSYLVEKANTPKKKSSVDRVPSEKPPIVLCSNVATMKFSCGCTRSPGKLMCPEHHKS